MSEGWLLFISLTVITVLLTAYEIYAHYWYKKREK